MVVRSPGSSPSHSARIERRSSLPERVFGSAVTKCTRDGRATAPSWLSTTFMTSASCAARFASVSTRPMSLRTAKAIATWPLSASCTPTTATSATFGCDEIDSSISRVPSRWPATLMTSSVRPRMK